jgi:hypothetical protein
MKKQLPLKKVESHLLTLKKISLDKFGVPQGTPYLYDIR